MAYDYYSVDDRKLLRRDRVFEKLTVNGWDLADLEEALERSEPVDHETALALARKINPEEAERL